MTFRLVIAAGGTGGHFYPGIAVLEALRARGPVEALFVGTQRGIEARKLPAMGESLVTFDVAPINNVGPWSKLRALFKLPAALGAAWRALERFAPHALLSVGGYASGPATLAAIGQGVPVVVVEPNAVPGLTNRAVGRFVTRACVAWEESAKHFRAGSVRVTGSPVRRAFVERAAAAADTRGEVASVLVLGGSQGARALNEHVPAAIATLVREGMALRVVHQCGERERERVARAYEALGLREGREAGGFEAAAFIEDVASAMAAADVVVCRSGAGTVSELCVVGRPAIYVPLPTAADDHQRKNAEAIVARGAGECLVQRELSSERLADKLRALLADRRALRAMGERAREIGAPRAAELVADELLAVRRRARASGTP